MSLEFYKYSNSQSQYLVGAYVADNLNAVLKMDGEDLVIKAKPTTHTPSRFYRYPKHYYVCHRYFAMALVLVAHQDNGFYVPSPQELIKAIEDENGFSFLDGKIQCTKINTNEYETRISGKYLNTLKNITDIPLS